MGHWLKSRDLVPQQIVSSSAVRAFTTAQFVAEECGMSRRITATSELYHASSDDWRTVIRALDAQSSHVLCVGHNPGIEDFLAETTAQFVTMSTAAIAHIQFEQDDWKSIAGSGDGTLLDVWRPKELPEA